MSKRVSTGKKLRFEVFKRDKFTCQYCGKQAPNVILEVDHIKPVSKAGTNDIMNLITSCFDCNRGKTKNELDDDSVLSRQRKQLELLQERREQIELMFQWRNELDKLDDDTSDMVVRYVENKISNFSLNHTGIRTISALTKKFGVADILESVDLSASKYLKYDREGCVIHESVEEFINKIGGILTIKNKPPIEQKLSYIKGICRNRFNYWDERNGSIILNNYVKAIKDYGWSEERILNDLETELIPKTIESRSWSDWRNLVEKWTEDVKGWGKQEPVIEPYEINKDELEQCAVSLNKNQQDILPALIFIGTAFDNFDESSLKKYLDLATRFFLNDLIEYYKLTDKNGAIKPSFRKALHETGSIIKFNWPIKDMLTFYLDQAFDNILQQYFYDIEIYNDDDAKPKYFEIILTKYLELTSVPKEMA